MPTEPSERKWEYYVTSDASLPPDATSPMMDARQMTDWFNHMDEQGWEFVGSSQKDWASGDVQNWMVFRRPYGSKP